jgi:site-specific DNA-cytosine methylase
VLLLSLFKGAHTDRIGLATHLRHEPDAVIAAETHQTIRQLLCLKFGYAPNSQEVTVDARGVAQLLSHDVWHLLAQDFPIMAQLVHSLPPDPVLVIVGGAPCQDVTMYSNNGGGAVGFAGERSALVHVIPILLRALAQLRPDATAYSGG